MNSALSFPGLKITTKHDKTIFRPKQITGTNIILGCEHMGTPAKDIENIVHKDKENTEN
jgi:hypothetical protein